MSEKATGIWQLCALSKRKLKIICAGWRLSSAEKCAAAGEYRRSRIKAEIN